MRRYTEFANLLRYGTFLFAVITFLSLTAHSVESSATASIDSRGAVSISDSLDSAAPLRSAIVANIPVLVAVPSQVTQLTPLIVMYHGFGPPNSPELLAKALPPIDGAITVYPSLPLLGARIPSGGADELLRRQQDDYIGQLLYPAILGAADELPKIIRSLSETYGLSKSRPIVLFGFSAGGAAVMLSLTESDVHPRAVLVVNSPLSIGQAVANYEQQAKRAYAWTAVAKDASTHYNVERNAAQIVRLNHKTAFLFLQSERDPGLSVAAARSAARALSTADSVYARDPDIKAVPLPGADHYVFGRVGSTTSESPGATVRRMIIDWIKRHAFGEG
jgi:predicted esterase